MDDLDHIRVLTHHLLQYRSQHQAQQFSSTEISICYQLTTTLPTTHNYRAWICDKSSAGNMDFDFNEGNRNSNATMADVKKLGRKYPNLPVPIFGNIADIGHLAQDPIALLDSCMYEVEVETQTDMEILAPEIAAAAATFTEDDSSTSLQLPDLNAPTPASVLRDLNTWCGRNLPRRTCRPPSHTPLSVWPWPETRFKLAAPASATATATAPSTIPPIQPIPLPSPNFQATNLPTISETGEEERETRSRAWPWRLHATQICRDLCLRALSQVIAVVAAVAGDSGGHDCRTKPDGEIRHHVSPSGSEESLD